MQKVFTSGEFSRYRKYNLSESRQTIHESYNFCNERKVTVFISHKHDDLEDLQDLIGFFEEKFDVQCYIDSRDPSMPDMTSGKTARIIKERIKQCDKFILLATNRAIASKWCNWELGFGDAQKFKNHIALFPFERSYESFNGNEYMEIYPHIVKYFGDENYSDGTTIKAGYYVRIINEDGSCIITPLEIWLER